MANSILKLELFGDIDYSMSEKVVGKLFKTNSLECLIHSEGGDLGSAFAIYDEITRVKNSTGTVTGTCFSASVLVLQAFKNRLARPNSQFILHEGRYEDADFEKMYAPHMNYVYKSLISTRIGWVNLESAYKERIFGVKKALELGIIDEIDEAY